MAAVNRHGPGGDAAELAVVRSFACVAVTDDGGDGPAVRVALRYAGDDFDRVRLSTVVEVSELPGARLSRNAWRRPKVDGDACGQAVDRAADGGEVRLPKDGDA